MFEQEIPCAFFLGLPHWISLYLWLPFGASWNSAKCTFFKSSWNFGQLFGSNWISFSTRTLYLLSFEDVTRSWVSQMVMSGVWTTDFLWAIFLHMVRVLFTTLCTCLSSSASISVVSIFLTSEATQGCWDVLFNPLYTTLNFHFLGNIGLIKYQDVGIGLDLLSAFSNGVSSDGYHSLFSRGCCHLLYYSQGQLPTSDNSFKSVQSFMRICSAFGHVEAFHLEDVFSLPLAVYLNKKISILSFLHVFWGIALVAITFSIKKEENLARQTSSKYSMTMNQG